MENNDMQNQMDEEYRAAERENAAFAGDRYRDWNDAMARQREGEMSAINQREYDSFQALNGRIRDTDLQLDRRKGVAGVAMLMNAYQNGGMSRREMSGAFSEALGSPVYGMQILSGLTGDDAKYNGSAAVYGVVNDNGKAGIGIVATVNPLQQLKMLQSAKLGDRTREVESRLYGAVSKQYTEDQLLKMGIRNPDGPYVTGGVSGKAVSRLFGRGGDRHSRISVFSTGGAGTGYTMREYDGHTGEDTGSVDHGQRDPNDPRYSGGWRLLSSGPGERLENGGYSQVRRYEGPNGEVIDVRDGESLSERIAEIRAKGNTRGAGRGQSDTGWHADVARINAASRERVAGMNNVAKLDLAKLTDSQKRDIASAARELKKYGIDVGLQIAQEGNASKERIATQTEAGRNARFTMRNDREWEKLAQQWEKIDNDFAVQMRKADTYGKRVDILEQKLKNDYDIALKKAKTADERAKVEADYKDRMASVAEGNIDLGWFKAETAAEQGDRKLEQGQQKLDDDKAAKEEDRKLKLALAGIRAGAKTPNGKAVGADDMKVAKYYIQLLDSGRLSGDNRNIVKDWLNTRGLLGMGDQPAATQGGGEKRTAEQIRANPQDGDTLPLKGGGTARYNAATKKWEKAN